MNAADRTGMAARTAAQEVAIMERTQVTRRPRPARQPEPPDLRTPSGRLLRY
ncbi:hypothetical protein ABK046_07585 [Streptomyces caeruleatus]